MANIPRLEKRMAEQVIGISKRLREEGRTPEEVIGAGTYDDDKKLD